MYVARIMLAASLTLSFTGCITDKPVVYKEHVLKKDAMKNFLGTYAVEKWPGNDGPERIRAYQKEGKHYLAWKQKQEVQVMFLLSKVPGSKEGVHLLTMPAQGDTNKAHLFFVGRVEKDKTMLWAPSVDQPVMKDRVTKDSMGRLKADEVRKFFAEHADDYVEANKPQVILSHKK